jgi:hypothetical protein
MTNEFKIKKFKNATVYTLESATSGATSASGATVAKPIGGIQRRNGDNLIAQEDNKVVVPVTQKPRQGPLRPQTGGGAHRDKKKEQKQGKEKHKKPYMEDHEVSMASNELKSIHANAKRLLSLVQQYGEQGDLEAWQQSKITKAADYLNSVLQSIGGEQDALDEISLGDYQRKAGMAKALAGMGAAFAPSADERARELATMKKREQGLARAKVRTDKIRAAADEKSRADAAARDREALPQMKAELEKLQAQFDPNFEYSDDHSFWSRQKEIQGRIHGLKQRIAKAEVSEDHSTAGHGWGRGSYDSYSTTRHGRGVAEDAPFGSNYAEQLAQQVFDHNPNIGDEKEVLNIGYSIAKRELGSRAQGIFRDEDFPSDFVSAYVYLKKQGVAESYEEHLNSLLEGLKDPKDNPCWKGYKPVGTKKKAGKTVPNCVPTDEGVEEDWQKVNRRDKTDGMSRKAVKAYRRENPGSKLKTAVTTKPSKLKKGGKAASRRKSFCARMSGMKRAHASAKTKRNPDSPINKALRRWNCEEDAYMNSLNVQVLEKLNPQADVDVWVKDFQKADPKKYHQFKNKTPQKKAQMAVAAHYAANEPSKKK